MLVIGLLLYIATLLVLIKVNVYVALGFIFVTSIIMKNIFPQLKGYIGEKRIRKLLHSLGDEYTVFNDMYVPKKDGKMTQIDHVLLSPYGIFVIETKNYTGWIFGQEQQKNWTQTIYNKKSRFYNPVMQNNTHVKALKHYLDMDVPMFSIVVFSNAATFKFKESFHQAHVIQNKQLKRTIKQYTTTQISVHKLTYISQLVQSLHPTTRKQKSDIKKQHLQHVKETAKPMKKKDGAMSAKTVKAPVTASAISPNIISTMETCPKCGNTLVLRQGKRGSFYGCQGFPRCRFTKDM